jgi:hypothetical protein
VSVRVGDEVNVNVMSADGVWVIVVEVVVDGLWVQDTVVDFVGVCVGVKVEEIVWV